VCVCVLPLNHRAVSRITVFLPAMAWHHRAASRGEEASSPTTSLTVLTVLFASFIWFWSPPSVFVPRRNLREPRELELELEFELEFDPSSPSLVVLTKKMLPPAPPSNPSAASPSTPPPPAPPPCVNGAPGSCFTWHCPPWPPSRNNTRTTRRRAALSYLMEGGNRYMHAGKSQKAQKSPNEFKKWLRWGFERSISPHMCKCVHGDDAVSKALYSI
jgi:hypothetical protein